MHFPLSTIHVQNVVFESSHQETDKSRMWEILKPAGLDPSKKSVSLKAKKMGV